MAREPYQRPPSLGSGRVEYTDGIEILHFGSPPHDPDPDE